MAPPKILLYSVGLPKDAAGRNLHVTGFWRLSGEVQREGVGESGWDSYRKGEGNGTPLQYSCLTNPMDGGAW